MQEVRNVLEELCSEFEHNEFILKLSEILDRYIEQQEKFKNEKCD